MWATLYVRMMILPVLVVLYQARLPASPLLCSASEGIGHIILTIQSLDMRSFLVENVFSDLVQCTVWTLISLICQFKKETSLKVKIYWVVLSVSCLRIHQLLQTKIATSRAPVWVFHFCRMWLVRPSPGEATLSTAQHQRSRPGLAMATMTSRRGRWPAPPRASGPPWAPAWGSASSLAARRCSGRWASDWHKDILTESDAC